MKPIRKRDVIDICSNNRLDHFNLALHHFELLQRRQTVTYYTITIAVNEPFFLKYIQNGRINVNGITEEESEDKICFVS